MTSRKKPFWTTLIFLLAAAQALTGCATLAGRAASDPVARVWSAVEREKAGDARYHKSRGREFLVFDAELRAELSGTTALDGAEAKRKHVEDVLARAKDLGDRAAELQIRRVESENPEELLPPYRAASASRLDAEIARVRALPDAAALDRYARELAGSIEESIKTKGRTWRQIVLLPFAPFVQAWMGYHIASTPKEEGGVAFAEADLYEAPAPPAGSPRTLDAEGLLAYYAPSIAVEKKKAGASYDAASDRFGRVTMEGPTREKAQPKIDVADPVVYGYAETKKIQGQAVRMLVYTLWFPERPKLGGGFDPEVGPTQGAMIRITLDAANRPVVYENVSSCGCYYKVFPSASLEARAKEAHGAPLEGKRFSTEARVPGKIDAAFPSLVEGEGRMTAFFSAGTHEVMDIRAKAPPSLKLDKRGAYRLAPYDELESLPFDGGTISMFDSEGLVRSADRLEAALLAASGMYHAGTPRQRGTLMIYFDQADFDDPKLLETYLRLPEHAFEAS